MNADGSGGLFLGCMGSPTWAPNATKIACIGGGTTFSPEIFVVNADGSGQTNLTNSAQADRHPMWSPDGTKIVFSSTALSVFWREGDIWVINADGTGPMKLTDYPAGGWAPAWSPDGTKIAFVSNRDGNDEIYVMNADGTGQTNLSNHPDADGGAGPDFRPAWSPDGSKILFQSWRSSGSMYVMNADGTNPVLMPNTVSASAESWSWSPDGSKFVFDKRRVMGDIWTMNTDGTGLSNLTDDPAFDYSPAWTP